MKKGRHISLALLLAIIIFFPGQSLGKFKSVRKVRAGVPPFEVIREVLQSNKDIKTNPPVPAAQRSREEGVFITWIADSDARVQPQDILAHPDKRVYSIRNLANQLDLASGAADYGVRYLYSPILLITGNTDSHAIRYFMEGYNDMLPQIRRELDHLHQPLAPYVESVKNDESIPPEELLLTCVEKNVDYQVELALERYGDRVRSGRLVIVGSVLDLADTYGRGPGRLLIINVNGETDDERLRRMKVLTPIGLSLMEAIGRKRVVQEPPPPELFRDDVIR